MTMPASWWMYLALVGATAAQRIREIARSRCHERILRRRGAVEVAPGHFAAMRAVHAAWLAGCVLESSLRSAPVPAVAAAALLVFFAGQSLRHMAMRELGERWTVRILVLPGAAPVRSGIYRVLRHPNYLGVILEIVALPLVHGCVITAITSTIANAGVLVVRIRAEERALSDASDYVGAFTGVRRLLPRRPIR